MDLILIAMQLAVDVLIDLEQPLCGEVTLNLFVSHAFLRCRIFGYIFAAAKKERLFATLLIVPFNPAKIAVVSFGDGEGSKEFHKASFITPMV